MTDRKAAGVSWSFRPLQPADCTAVREVAIEGWQFAYPHLSPTQIAACIADDYADHCLAGNYQAMREQRQHFEVACDIEGRIVGFCHVTLHEGAAELLRLYITPTLIGQGLGSQLSQHGEQWVLASQRAQWFLFVNHRNRIGIAFYERHGFQHCPDRDRDDEFEPRALWCMVRHLGGHG